MTERTNGGPGMPPSAGPTGPADHSSRGQHPGTDNFFDSLRRIDVRRADDGWLGGVCAGLAQRLGLDPVVIRAGAVLLGLVFGIGVALYLVAWLFIPATDDTTHVERGMRHGEGSSIFLLVVATLVVLGSLPWFGTSWDGGWSLGGLVITALVGWGLWLAWQSREAPGEVGRSGGYGAAPARYAAAPGTGHPPPVGTAYPAADETAPVTPVPPAPRRPRRLAGGPAVALLAAGLTLVTYGALLWAGVEYDWPGNHQAVAVAGALAVLGALVMVLGLAGRRSGFPGFLAALTLVATVVLAPLPQGFAVDGRVGDETWTPTTVAEGEAFRVGVGQGVLDLRGLDPAVLEGQTVESSVSIGELTVLVPEDLTVQVLASSGVGEIRVREDGFGPTGTDQQTGGINVEDDLVLGEGPVDLVVRTSVGLGRISVERN